MFSKKRLRQRAGDRSNPPDLPTPGAGAGTGAGGAVGGLEGRPLGAATTQTGELEDFGDGVDHAW